jgi:PAS domain S-box-containing protein
MTSPRRYLSQIVAPVILLSSLLITALYWWQLTTSAQRLREETLNQASLRARQVNSAAAAQISQLFRVVDVSARELASLYVRTTGLHAFDVEVREMSERLPAGSIVQVGVVDARGYLTYSSLGSNERIYLGDREHVKVHLEKQIDRLFVSKPLLGRVSKQWSIQASRPIRRNGRFDGVIVLSVSPAFLHQALVSLSLGSDDAIAVFRETGEYLARNLEHENSLGKSAAPDRPFVGAAAPVSGSLRVVSNFDGRPRIYEWLRVKDYPITVVLGLSEETALKPVERMIALDRLHAEIGTVLWWVLTLAVILLLRRAGRQQELVADAEQKYRIFADFTHDWETWQDPEGRHLLVTPSCRRVTGYGPAEFSADPTLMQRIVHPDDKAQVAEHFRIVHSAFEAGARIEFRIIDKTGQIRWIEHYCDAVVGKDGDHLGRRASNRDITDRKDAEEALRRLTAELEQRVAQRTAQFEAANRELEEFSYSISHDMRTPLRAIDGFSKILLDEHGETLDSEGRRLQAEIRLNAQHMGRQLDAMLDFLNLGKRKLVATRIDMADMVRQVFAELVSSAPIPPARLETGPLPPAWGDREMIRQVMRNLLSNALKFSSPQRDAVIEVAGTANAQENTYRVRDNGVGFDMRYADKLFKVFERVHPTGQYEGTAIGLASVKRIVERHGGRAWAEGSVDGGATFYFSLPNRADD